MGARRGLAIACVLGLLAGVAVAGPVAGRTTTWHTTFIGPGVRADWVNGNVTTSLLVFHQLNAPGTQGYFEEVVILRDGWNDDGSLAWEAVYDSWDAPQQPAITIEKPLAWASVNATVPFVECVEVTGTCPSLPSQVSVAEEWTGEGPIERIAGQDKAYVDHVPGLMLVMARGVNFIRAAELADPDPFDGALGDLGELYLARFFDVHHPVVQVCHSGAVCE